MEQTIYTIGHSTRAIDEFIHILKSIPITLVVDIRTIPRSRRNPQFNTDILELELKKAGIKYRHRKGLGGLRHPRKDSVNTGWEVETFRGYADYMQTDEFRDNLRQLLEESREENLAVMCAEAVYWRCHRRLVSDALTVKGVKVLHITGEQKTQPHTLTPWIRVDGESITYPPLQQELPLE